MPARSVDLGKHSVYTHFTKDRNCEICQRTKITRAPWRRRIGRVVLRAEIFGDLTTSDLKVLSEGAVVQDLATQWIQSHPCKTKTSQETQRSLQKFLEPNRKLKVIYTDDSLEFAKHVKIFPGIIVRQHHTDQKQMGLLREQYAEWKKVRLEYCCNQVWMKNGGQIPWNVLLICETFKTSCLMGKLHARDVFGKPFEGPIIPFGSLVEYYPISARDQSRIHQFGKKVLLFCASDTLCTRCEFGRVTYWFQTLRSWKRWTHQKSALKDSMRRKKYFPKKMENSFSSRRWTNQTSWRRWGTENTHLDTGTPNSRGKSNGFSWRIRRVSSTTSRVISGCWWSDKWFLVQVRKLHIPPSRWTKSQTLLAERRIIPYSIEIHWRIQNYSYEFGCQAGETHRWLLEYRWVTRFVRSLDTFHTIYSVGREISCRKNVVRWEINKKTASIQARSSMARTMEVNGKARQAEGEAKVV